MSEQIIYNDISYNVLGDLLLGSTLFTICMNINDNKIIYLRKKCIHDRDTYVSFANLIKILPQYQTIASQNKIKVLDLFVEQLTNKFQTEHINFLELSERVYNFQKYLKYNDLGLYVTDNSTINIDEDILNEYKNIIHNISDNYHKLTMQELLDIDELSIDNSSDGKKRTFNIFNNKVLNIYMILIVVAAVGFIACAKTIFDWKTTGTKEEKIMEEILSDDTIIEEIPPVEDVSEVANSGVAQIPDNDYWNYMKMPLISVDFNKLLQKNSDTVGWLYVNNTNINYPVVQSGDNSYYLNHAYDRSTNIAGWLFGDYRSDFNSFKRNTVIYGHGRVDSVMFGSLDKTLNKSWYTNTDNQIIQMSTPTQNTLWKIVSIYTIPVESYYLTHNFENDSAYNQFLQTIQSRSIYNFGEALNTTDKILTLSTCKDTKGNRIVIHAKLIKSESR